MAIQVIILSKRRLYIYLVIGSATSLPLGTIIYRQMVCGYHDRILSSTVSAKSNIGRACMSLQFSVKWPTY